VSGGASIGPSSARPLISIIVPYLDTPLSLEQCVASLGSGCDDLAYELIVVDNGSRAETAPRIVRSVDRRVLRNMSNRGFAAACNQAAAVAAGRYLLFLNSDAILTPRSIVPMVEAMEQDAGLAAVAPLHRTPTGFAMSSGREWLAPVTQALALLGFARSRSPREVAGTGVLPVPWLSGAALLVRARTYRLLSGFDEGYFFYEEDEDLCWRFARRGYRVAVCPAASIGHEGSVSAQAEGAWPVLTLYTGQARFVRRRCGVTGEWIYRTSTAAAIAMKVVRGRILGRPAPTLARVAPSRVLRLLCSPRMEARIAEE
jgi:N-acetylglucosaminyl-diphospho-decaprenol L-rhamnosyltransferase